MQPPPHLLGSVFALGLVIASGAAGGLCSADEPSDELLAPMLQRAASMKVALVDPPRASAEVELIAKPLMRYSDQPRGIKDASFWCWHCDGRPVAFQKIEFYDRLDESLQWFYCFASASEDRIKADWKAGEHWEASEPGIRLQTLGDETIPNESAFRIALQAKNIARRFSVRLDDIALKTREQLRFLDRPIYQFGDPRSDAMGSVFGFASNGTNPDALLIVQLDRGKTGKEWKYGWIQMTSGKLTAQLDGQVVWTAPFRPPNFDRPSKFESWMFFYESTANK